MIVGLTGGIACGKSTVSSLFKQLGSQIIDADQIARKVVEPGQEGLDAVIKRFGTGVINEDGLLDRKALGHVIFNNEEARKDLNSILHPLIRVRMEQEKVQALQAGAPLIIMDIPLLFESKLENTVEASIVVYIPVELQVERLMARDKISEEEANKRINAQWSIEKKKHLGDYIIDNSRSLDYTEEQVEHLFHTLTRN